ncbi:hypothetical protein RHMOL_Rhmol11G0113200 [Rhododendron molle]|uniref:Uncharacterized protein n=1 Tax=Rhododendron molle TaxID=49168 RepID=A0ACC0LS63_RHOML|nr:hypothetical protein RHMOL_Rhmol11G0113200 [Rhododendron molle]
MAARHRHHYKPHQETLPIESLNCRPMSIVYTDCRHLKLVDSIKLPLQWEPDVKTKQRIEQLKEKVREMIVASADKPSHKLSLIDAIQRLGVGYHFETEIETTLEDIYETYHEMANDEDLYTVALSFRVLRQQGHPVSCANVFNKLMDNKGKFKESLIGDVRGLCSLYEATHLRVHQEEILDEALEFSTTHLNSALLNLSNNPIAAQVVHALDQPIHQGLTRLESRHYISFYEKDDSHNKFEQERGHATSAVECYMKQYGTTEEEAVAEFQKQVTSAWKDNNSECLRPTAVPMPVLLRVFNVARTFHIVYKDADSYTHSRAKFKEIVTSVLVDSVPI